MENLVTDRTQSHVDRLKTLQAKGYNNLTSSEKSEWNGDAQKGAYNYTDLNRVESAVAEIAASIGLDLETKTDWTLWDVPTQLEMERYLSNVSIIQKVCGVSGITDKGTLGNFVLGEDVLGGTEIKTADVDLPSTMDRLTYSGANAIEQVLSLAYQVSDSYARCGDIFCGEVE